MKSEFYNSERSFGAKVMLTLEPLNASKSDRAHIFEGLLDGKLTWPSFGEATTVVRDNRQAQITTANNGRKYKCILSRAVQ